MYDGIFVKLDTRIVPISSITAIDISDISDSMVHITTSDGILETVSGFFAVELVWLLKPGALEGNPSIKWMRGWWMIHNFIGHPLMQILALFKQYNMAIWIHDATIPKPINKKGEKS